MSEADAIALRVAGRLLAYPDVEFFASLPDLRRETREMLEISGLEPDFAASVLAFADRLSDMGQPAAAEEYVAIFDHASACSLYLSWHRYGNDRSQGRAMAALNGLYRSCGLEPAPGSLPDYLPRVLEFLSVAPDAAIDIILDAFGPEMDALAKSMEALESSHAPVLQAALAPLRREFPERFLSRKGADPTRRPMASPEPEPLEPLLPRRSPASD